MTTKGKDHATGWVSTTTVDATVLEQVHKEEAEWHRSFGKIRREMERVPPDKLRVKAR